MDEPVTVEAKHLQEVSRSGATTTASAALSGLAGSVPTLQHVSGSG